MLICTGFTLFALVLHLNCTTLSQSESRNFFMRIINEKNAFSPRLLRYANVISASALLHKKSQQSASKVRVLAFYRISPCLIQFLIISLLVVLRLKRLYLLENITIEFMFAGINMFWARLRLILARAARRGLK